MIELTPRAADKIREFSPDILIPVSRENSSIYDFYKAEELVEAGRRAAIRVLNNLNEEQNEVKKPEYYNLCL